MNEFLFFVLMLIGGFALGILFFGGLWLTVKIGVKSRKPAALFIVSSLIRTAVLLVVFYYIIKYDWHFALICMIGFIVGRYFMLRKIKTFNKSVQFNLNKK